MAKNNMIGNNTTRNNATVNNSAKKSKFRITTAENIRSKLLGGSTAIIIVLIAVIIMITSTFQAEVKAEPASSDKPKPAYQTAPDISAPSYVSETQDTYNLQYVLNTPVVPDSYNKIKQNSKSTLYCNLRTGAIIVENNDTGYLWRSTIDNPEEYGLENLSSSWQNYVSSLFTLNYVNLIENKGLMEKAYSTVNANITSSASIENGISLNYNFSKIGISLTIEIILEQDGLTIKIPADRVKETSDFGIVYIELMPFFGAESNNNIDGYIFYPDGSGALMKYEKSEKRPKFIKPYKGFIFSSEKVDISEYIQMEREKRFNPMLPVYGIKNGENAYLAIASEGAEETAILVYPYGYLINLNRAGFELYYRHFYSTILSNITLRGGNTAKNLTSTKADKELTLQNHEVKFIFLDNDNANYSGMANAYRDYLVENSELRKGIKDPRHVPLEISLFMGIKEQRMLFDKYIPMTSFQQAKIIAEQFKNNGVDDLQISLIGWSKGGYGFYPDRWPPERKLGGVSEMENLFDYAADNNIKVFLQTNSIDAVSENMTFSKRNDVVIQGNGLPVTGANDDRFILNPFAYFERIKGLINKIPLENSKGISLEKIGKLLYHDYNKNNPSSRAQTLKTWKETFMLAKEQGMLLGIEGGNAYTLKYADYLFNIPVKSSGHHIADETVPFFHMVVHGMIPYTSEPGNLAFDLNKQKLQWIEYGCMPSFELTFEDTIKLKYTNYNRLFNSQYESWIDTAVNIYKEFNDKLLAIWDAEIIRHEKITSELIKVSYSNGKVVYINYSNEETSCDGYKIKAGDYIVTDGRGTVK